MHIDPRESVLQGTKKGQWDAENGKAQRKPTMQLTIISTCALHKKKQVIFSGTSCTVHPYNKVHALHPDKQTQTLLLFTKYKQSYTKVGGRETGQVKQRCKKHDHISTDNLQQTGYELTYLCQHPIIPRTKQSSIIVVCDL
jgi:hypothetical protein